MSGEPARIVAMVISLAVSFASGNAFEHYFA
jgi:hypothetical protein